MKNLDSKKFIAVTFFGLLFLTSSGQNFEITGSVRDRQTTEGLPFATVSISNAGIGTTADEHGFFRLNVPFSMEKRWLRAAFLGYATDSVLISSEKTKLQFNLKPSAGSVGEVVISGTMKETSRLESPILVEVFNPVFFKKNPTPSVFEALSMVNGVQPQLNCNVCGTGDIHINGMEGPYTMILIDGMPIVSALSTVYGLSGIPNSLVKRIEIVKGPASTLYGSEAVGGLINIITKEPTTAPRIFGDVSATDWQEMNGDLAAKFKVKKATGLVGANGFWFQKKYDRNADGFTDVPLQKRISVFNKWDFELKNGRSASVAARFVHENRWGGELDFSKKWRGTDSIYGESVLTNRAELIGEWRLPRRLAFQYSYNAHFQDSYYGTTKYLAEQHTAFGQIRWQKSLDGGHDLLIGAPFRFVFYDDNSPATASASGKNEPQRTVLPGVFVQDEWAARKKTTILAGIRYDRHSEHGEIFTPRLSFKQKIDAAQTVRLSFGNGYRVVNLFTEDHAALTGSREVVIAERLRPERSWNGNLNFSTQLNPKWGYAAFDASLFYTFFTNKITGDFDSDPQKIIYDNLRGRAISRGFSVNSDFSWLNGLKIMVGATAMDVFQIEKNAAGDELKTPQLFAPKFSANAAASWAWSKHGLVFDLTALAKSPMFLPVVPNDFRPAKSPFFALLNFQITKKRGAAELYGGVKNLLNFVPKNPLLRPFDPFDKQIGVDNPFGYAFDTTYNYAPLQGARVFLGVRWTMF